MFDSHESRHQLKCTRVLSEDTPSCVRRLLEYIPHTLVNVAPEKLHALVEALGEDQLELELIESRELIHNYCQAQRKITLSTRPVELLWAQSYAYFVWYSQELANVQPSGQQIDPHRKPEVHQALELLGWATRGMVRSQQLPWPNDAPSPEPEPRHASCAHVAQDLCLLAVGFILHHELAHHRLQHQATSDIDQEREADYEAIDWIMGGVEPTAPEYRKRALGASVALLYLLVTGVYSDSHGGDSHPKDYNRLMYTMERHVPPDRHDVWGFIAGMLSLYCQDARVPCRQGPHDNFHEWCNALVEELARKESLAEGGRTMQSS